MDFDITCHLSKDDCDFLKIVSCCAKKQNINIYIVGGAIRDVLLDKKIKDIDLIVDGSAIDFASKLPFEIETKSIHEEFCTAKVCYKNKIFDIATTRKEKYLANGALPTVTELCVDLADDVARRDFTINSIYLKIENDNDNLSFSLIDLLDGSFDIKLGQLKVIHKNSYLDDPTRIIRGLDFKYRFNMDFSSDDKNLIKKTINKINLEKASIDRIKAVFHKAFLTNNHKLIFRESVQNKYYRLISNIDLEIDLDKIYEIIDKFELKNADIADFYLKIFKNNEIEILNFKNELEIYNIFSKFLKADLAYYFYKTNDENVLYFNKIKDIKLNIKGDDLLNMNIAQGKIYKDIFDSLLLEKIKNNEAYSTKEDEINWIKKHYLK